MSLREELVSFGTLPHANVAALCRRFGVSRKTAYKWIGRRREHPDAPPESVFADRSRRPHATPTRTATDVERRIVELRHQHPAWGARKLRRRLADLGRTDVPTASVVHDVLRRHGLIDPAESRKHEPFTSFERAEPNDLWQMDFKGFLATDAGVRCHPLTALDDHSRFNLVLRACADQRHETVKAELVRTFQRYGLPRCLLADNGPPWGSCGADNNWTRLGVWLVRLGVTLIHGRPHHPQTQGKEERFHRTLVAEVIGTRRFRDPADAQVAFDAFRPLYNHHRPHEALGLATPATRYRPSPRGFPAALPPVQYGPLDQVRKVDAFGRISYRGRPWPVGTAFTAEPVAVRPTDTDGKLNVYYCHQRVAEIDLRDDSEDR
jgi:transposase InsO family protein